MRIDAVDRDCYKELVDKYRFLISDEDYNHYIATGVKSSDMIDFFNISVTASENFFDERSDHDLDDPNEPQWSKDVIIEARTKLAYALYSQDPRNQKRLIPYEEFMSNPDLLMYMDQAKDLATRISETKKELVSELNLRRTEAIADYQRNKKIIDSYDFVDKDMPFGPFAYMSGTSSAGENYIRTENGLVYKPIVAIDAGFVDIDETIIHEVNHEIERHVIRVDDKGFESITGWDRIETTFSDTQDNSDPSYRGITKPYEFLSEYVNDTIASEITDQMHSKGYYIFSPIRRPGCPYKIIGPLFRDFYQEYKKDIIESRKLHTEGKTVYPYVELNYRHLSIKLAFQ